jgi:hypothetical protein
MSRKIEDAMMYAIRNGNEFNQGNTTVHHDHVIGDTEVEVRLHGHLIAKRYIGNKWKFSLCGYNTRTTRSRLSAIARDELPLCNGIGTKQGQASIRYRDGREVNVPDNGWFTP